MMEGMKKRSLCFILLLFVLPAVTHAQEVKPVPVDTVVVNETTNMANEMIRIIQAAPDCFNSFKGDFYLADADSNLYYTANCAELHTGMQYVDVKKTGGVSFIATWVPKDRADHFSMIAVTAFTTYITREANGKEYVPEALVREPGSTSVRYALREKGPDGKRMAMFIFDGVIKEATFIVDSGLDE
jgi:hypothetical protein